jgi:phosphinothricin acetyltransferase
VSSPTAGLSPLVVEPVAAAHWEQVSAIYREGIASGHATFECEPPAGWERRLARRVPGSPIVALLEGAVVGWAALSPVSDRCAYAGVAEGSIYVARAARGRGAGSALLAEMIDRSEALGIWTLQAGIFPENQPSVNPCVRHGLRIVGVRERLRRMEYEPLATRRRDLLLLERRSARIGRE